MTLDLLADLLTDATEPIQHEACDFLGVDLADLADAVLEATPVQRAALEVMVMPVMDDHISAEEMCDLADAALARTTPAHTLPRRLAAWRSVLAGCSLLRGDSAPTAILPSLSIPTILGTVSLDRRRLNREIRGLSRVLWGAALLRDATLAASTDRQYTAADIASVPVLRAIIQAGTDDLALARRVRQLRAALDRWHAITGKRHAAADLALELGL